MLVRALDIGVATDREPAKEEDGTGYGRSHDDDNRPEQAAESVTLHLLGLGAARGTV
jgi:hypothetical protein